MHKMCTILAEIKDGFGGKISKYYAIASYLYSYIGGVEICSNSKHIPTLKAW